MSDIIAAIATGRAPCAIGILRLSGPGCAALTGRVFTPKQPFADAPDRRLVLGLLHDRHGRVIDECLGVVCRAPHSYTGEDVVELSCHGGNAVARRLVLLGGRVTVAARSPEQRANARCAGCRAAPLTALPTLLPGFDAVINTVPAPVLPRALLQQLPGGALIIDLASLPGGTDFAAAEELGLHAEHALALPGRCAPQTAGALIAQTVLAILEERDPDERSTAP